MRLYTLIFGVMLWCLGHVSSLHSQEHAAVLLSDGGVDAAAETSSTGSTLYPPLRDGTVGPSVDDDVVRREPRIIAVSYHRVPYLDQKTVPPLFIPGTSQAVEIASVSCGCVSMAMVLGYHEKITADLSSMRQAVLDCFKATSSPRVGVNGPEAYVVHLKRLGFGGSAFLPFETADAFILATARRLLLDGYVPILSLNGVGRGHFVVVLGIEGDEPHSADLIVHDPNGRWGTCATDPTTNCFDPTSNSGRRVRYSYKTITARGGRLYVIR